ncbi:hypothetical protein ACFQV2_02295 [Actinokineospora soli]|uniref:Uncharacterized protein n=1 Tax=Actinokineospora soli TaxID=1048753 RepID=A0ABW2TGC8_9PSEU
MRATIGCMELRGSDFDHIPAGNIRVPRVEFARVWHAAELRSDADPQDWALTGVVMTCRWIANATVRQPDGSWYSAPAPVTMRTGVVYEELIADELLQAERLDIQQPAWLANRPGWLDAVLSTFAWAWRRSGVPPVDVPAVP